MSDTNPRAPYAAFTDSLIADFRAHGGKTTSGPFVGRNLLLLTTKGARSGEDRLVPVVYSKAGDRYVVVASKGGAPTNPAWYANLVANPVVSVEVDGEKFNARATAVEGPERDRLYDCHAAENPSFNDYRTKTARRIPVVLLDRID
jgi:deazaflavin-dependent oxidoreductase (nitroreductase family)